jgi:phospholipid/cholesterol/gamma-HCH transport system substrate-binding protein
MENKAMRLEYKVGLFVGLGLVALMVSILLLGGDRSIFTRYVHLRTQLSEVQGLFPGSIVSLSGMPVGNIEKINFVESANKLELVLKIDRRFADRLVEGTSAEMRTQGALGDKYIYLSPGPSGGKPLAENTLLPSTETDYMKLLTSREDGVARVIDLIKDLQVLVASVNQNGQIGTVMKNITEASTKLSATMGKADSLITELRTQIPDDKKLGPALTSLASILEKIDHGKGSLGLLINDPTIHQNLKALLGSSPRTRYMKDMIDQSLKESDSSGNRH